MVHVASEMTGLNRSSLTLGRAMGGAFQAAGERRAAGLAAAEAAADVGRLSAKAWHMAKTCKSLDFPDQPLMLPMLPVCAGDAFAETARGSQA